MKKPNSLSWLFCLVTSVAMAGVSSTARTGFADDITIAGSSTVRPIVDKAVKKFKQDHPGASFVVGGGGSSHGVKAAGDGDVMIGMASRAMKDQEKTTYPNLQSVKIAVDGIAIVVHRDNSVGALTTGQVRDIFSGRIKNWKEVGGQDAPIQCVSANTHHGTFDVFCKHLSLEGAKAKGGIAFSDSDSGDPSSGLAKSADGNKASLASIMTKPHGITYASIGVAEYLKNKGAPIRLIEFDGVEASLKNVVDGKYKPQRSLFLLTNGEVPTGTKDFIEFVTGESGRELIRSEGYIPTH